MKVYLSPDGNWGDAEGLLVFDSMELSDDLYNRLIDDPEGSYEEVSEIIQKEEK